MKHKKIQYSPNLFSGTGQGLHICAIDDRGLLRIYCTVSRRTAVAQSHDDTSQNSQKQKHKTNRQNRKQSHFTRNMHLYSEDKHVFADRKHRTEHTHQTISSKC